MKKLSASLLLIAVMILAISAVSAAEETSDSAMQAVDGVAVDEVAAPSVDEVAAPSVDEVAAPSIDNVVSTDNTANALADPGDGTNFTALQYLIDNKDDDNLPLFIEKDYTRNSTEGIITINKNITIISMTNHVIDGNNGGIFKISQGVTVFLNGLTFINGNSNNGGAIYNEGELKIKDCSFEYNTADFCGGAIYSNGILSISDSGFYSNNVTSAYDETAETNSQGGAIYAGGDKLEITNSEFNENTATPNDHGEGGAIYAKVTTTTISETGFGYNKGFQGGAVKLIGVDQDTLVFNDCYFEGNAALQGGAIDAQGCANLRINDTTFEGNLAYSDRYIGLYPDMGAAAAIGAAYVNDIIIYVNNSHFISNTVISGPIENSGYGAAIISTGSLIVDNTEFKDNEADKFATLRVYHNGNAGTVSITNSNFTGNKANKGDAAVLYASASKTTTIDNCNFEDNEAYGNGVILADGVATIKNSVFTGNTAANDTVIYANNKLTLQNNSISTTSGNVVLGENGEVISQINVNILNNGTIDDNYDATVAITATITDDNGNLIADANGFKFVTNGAEAEATYDAINKVYTGNLALPGPGIFTVNITYTGSNKLNVKTATIKNYRGTFKDLNDKVTNAQNNKLDLEYNFAYTPELGDVAYVDGVVISNSLTIDGHGYTISGSNAARIFNVTNAVTFTLTNVTLSDGLSDEGAAILVDDENAVLNIDYVTFSNNKVTDFGAISNYGTANINHSVFDGNDNLVHTGDVGASAIFNAGTLIVNNTVFENNVKVKANRTAGDQLVAVLANMMGNFEIYNSNFTNNSGIYGGALYTATFTPIKTVIDNCRFINNTAYCGGAIYGYGPVDLDITNSYFENNIANGFGTPGYTAGGGAIVLIEATDTFIYNCTFKENEAINGALPAGGAIHVDESTVAVDSCVFESNSASNGNSPIGGAISSNNLGVLTVTNSNFTGNTAANGNAIFSAGELTLSGNKVFSDEAEIVSTGEVKSPNGFKITVMDNGTHSFSFRNITLYANITDDAGNLLVDSDFKFVVGTQEPINATYNANTKLYEATYTPTTVGEFVVTMTYTGTTTLDIKTATITFAKSLIDIQNMIDAANPGDTITLDGDYAYIEEFDSSIKSGIKVNKVITIDGKGYTISGSNAARIFNVVTGGDLTLINVTLTEGKGVFYNGGYSGGAIIMGLDTNLTVKDSKFVNNTVDFGGAIYSTADNVNIKITDSEFINNTANYMVGAIMVSGKGTNVTITGSNFTANKGIMFGEAGAIFVQDVNSFKVDNCNFINNTADLGAAIDIAKYAGSDFEVVITNCNFTDNSAKAVSNYKNGNVTIEDSTFTNNGGATDYAISNSGTLSLSGNTIDNLIYSSGKIASTIKVEVLDGEVKTINTLEANLYAKVTDDNGNLIKDGKFKFTINNEEVPAVYNDTSKLYEATYTLPVAGIYPVNITYVTDNNLEVKNATIKSIKGTYTDLQEQIVAKQAGETLELPYDFIYNEVIDGAGFPDGVVIDKAITIDGKGHTISGNNSHRIFRVTAATTLNNITFVNGSAIEFGGAIYADADLTVSNSIFDNNVVAKNDANGGAIMVLAAASDVTLNINNVNFTNNKVDNGGAALAVAAINGKTLTYNIYDSLFENNIAETDGVAPASGGAIFSYGTTVGLINNTEFKGNEALTGDVSNGGAIKIQFGGILTVANSTFEDNKAGHYGGAISVQANTGMNNVLIVKNCTFTNNDANYGAAIGSRQYVGESAVSIDESTFNEDSAVYIDALTTAIITTSQFNGADYPIYNLGTLLLNGNNVGAIYNNGTIMTLVNATFLGGQNITAALGEEVYPYATLTDDNGNVIYDPNFNITVNGNELETSFADGKYTAKYTIADAGDNVVDTTYTANDLVKTTGNYTVEKANATLIVTCSNITEGENATIYIELIGINNTGLNTTDEIGLMVDNKLFILSTVDGKVNQTLEGLTKGTYAVTATFGGNNNYNYVINSTVLYVKGISVLTIDPIDVTEYGDIINVTVNLTDKDGNGITGIVVVDGENILIDNGTGFFQLADVPLGTYNITLAYAGDNDYNASVSNTVSFTVIPKNITDDVEVDVDDEIAPNNVTVIVYGPCEGTTYNVTIDGQTVQVKVYYNETYDEICGVATFSGLTAGNKTVTVVVDDGNYTMDPIKEDFKYKYEPDFNITFNGTYPKLEITIEGTDGNYTVYVDSEHQVNITVVDGKGTETISDIAAGVYFVDYEFHETDQYYYDWDWDDVYVAKAQTVIEVVATQVTYPDAVVVNVTGNADGTYTVKVGDKSQDVDLKAGEVKEVIFEGLAANEAGYAINVTGGENENYTAGVNDTETVKVLKGDVVFEVNATTPVEYPGRVIVTIKTDVAGNVTFKGTVKEIFAGESSILFANPAAGNYTIPIHFEADNYNPVDKNVTFEVTKATPTVTVEAIVAVGTYPGALTVVVASNVDGTYNITVGTQTEEVTVVNGIGSKAFENVAAGTQNATVTFGGNKNYTDITVNKEFTINKAVPEFTVEVAETTYPDAVEITITGTDGTYTVIVDDAHNATITVSGGKGTGSIAGLEAGTYNNVPVSVAESANYTAASGAVNFTVAQKVRDFTVIVYVMADTYPGVVNITIVGDNGTYNVAIGDIKDNITVENNIGSKIISNIPAGDKTLVTVLPESGSYAEVTKENTFTINKAEINPTVSAVDSLEFGQNYTVTVAVPDDYTGVPVVEIDGKKYAAGENISLAIGTYNVNVVFPEDANYNATTVTKQLNVTKDTPPATAINVTVSENTTIPTFSIDLKDENATGFLLVEIDGKRYYAPVENGKASITTAPLATGNYTANVTYTGDDKYADVSKLVDVNVTSEVSEDNITVPSAGESDTANTITVDLPSDATGYVEVDVDGKKYYAPVENGKATVTVPALAAGQHNVTATYSGDSKYPSVTKKSTIDVKDPVFKLSGNKDIAVRYTGTNVYKVLVTRDGKAVGAGQTVTFKFNGKTYYVKTDKKGYASLKINANINIKKYTITATYKGITVKNTLTVNSVVVLHNRNLKKSAKYTVVRVLLKAVNGKYLANKNVKFRIFGKNYFVKTNSKGIASMKVTKAMVKPYRVGGKYTYAAYYGKDKAYSKFTIYR